jgi:hypothetical protein
MAGDPSDPGAATSWEAFQRQLWQREQEMKTEMEALRAQLMNNPYQAELEALRAEIHARQPFAATAHIGNAVRPPKPERFSGTKEDAANVESWVYGMSKYFDAGGPSFATDSSRLIFAQTMLQRNALDWWRFVEQQAMVGAATAPNTWAAFGAAIVQRFQPVNAERMARDRLLTLHQTGSVAAYAMEFQRLLLRCPDLSAAEQLHRFISGLKTTTQRELVLREPTTLAAAIDMAERVDHLTYRLGGRGTGNTPGGQRAGGPTPMELGALDEEDADAFQEGERDDDEATPEELMAALAQVRLNRQAAAGAPRRPTGAPPGPARGINPRRDQKPFQGRCYHCNQPGHRIAECPQRARGDHPKGGAPSA